METRQAGPVPCMALTVFEHACWCWSILNRGYRVCCALVANDWLCSGATVLDLPKRRSKLAMAVLFVSRVVSGCLRVSPEVD